MAGGDAVAVVAAGLLVVPRRGGSSLRRMTCFWLMCFSSLLPAHSHDAGHLLQARSRTLADDRDFFVKPCETWMSRSDHKGCRGSRSGEWAQQRVERSE